MCCPIRLGFIGILLTSLLGPCCPTTPPETAALSVAPTTIVENGGTATLTASFAAAWTEDVTLHIESEQTPATATAAFTLSSSDIMIAAGATTGTATVTTGTFPANVTSLAVDFRITRISTATCSWDVDIPAETLTIVHPGGLQVTLTPAEAVAAGAKWSVDGGAQQDSGATVTPLAAGAHPVTYLTLLHWDAPANESVTITNGAVTQITRNYTPHPGTLVVNISPSTLPGAAWSINTDPGTTHTGGSSLTLAPGTYTVSFTDVMFFSTPAPQTATIASDEITVINGLYLETPN